MERSSVEAPPLRYHGGKWRLVDWILGQMPPHEAYVEPFAGGGSVLLAKAPTRLDVYNDLDEEVVNLFRVLRDPDLHLQLQRAWELTPFSRREFELCWAPAEDPVERARRLIVRSRQSVGNKARLERNGWRTRVPAPGVVSPADTWARSSLQLAAWHQRLRGVVVECLPYPQVLALYDAPGTLFYVDPPYLTGTRGQRQDRLYQHELSDADHVALLQHLRGLRGMVMLSGYPSALYDEALVGWSRTQVHARAQGNHPRVEVLWMNPAAAGGVRQAELALPHMGD